MFTHTVNCVSKSGMRKLETQALTHAERSNLIRVCEKEVKLIKEFRKSFLN